jgi:hypothetical protein
MNNLRGSGTIKGASSLTSWLSKFCSLATVSGKRIDKLGHLFEKYTFLDIYRKHYTEPLKRTIRLTNRFILISLKIITAGGFFLSKSAVSMLRRAWTIWTMNSLMSLPAHRRGETTCVLTSSILSITKCSGSSKLLPGNFQRRAAWKEYATSCEGLCGADLRDVGRRTSTVSSWTSPISLRTQVFLMLASISASGSSTFAPLPLLNLNWRCERST